VRALFLLTLTLSACSPAPPLGPDGGPHGCKYPVLGDLTQPIQLEPLGLGPNMTAAPIADGGMVTLAFPPQGGRVIFAGVRATNIDPCGVQLDGALRDETTRQVRYDSRTINLVPGPDGWGSSDPGDPSTFANVAVCPNEWSKTNLYGTPYALEVGVTDRRGRALTTSIEVIPECSEPAHAAECLCLCMGGYVLGQSCAADAGAGDGGDGGA
jgi:hypothetical protein